MIADCGEDIAKHKQLKYDLIDVKIHYADLINELERYDNGFCVDFRLFRQYKHNANKAQRYLDQVKDIIKDLTIETKKEEGLKREQEKERYRLEKERLKDERIKADQSKERLFIKLIKERLSYDEFLEVWRKVDELVANNN